MTLILLIPRRSLLVKSFDTKALLVTLVVTGVLIIGVVGYFPFSYLNDHGAQDIIDNVKPFTK